MDLERRVERLFPQLVMWRRDFHRFPELSYHERQTSKKVAEYLETLGLEVKRNVGGHGVIGLLRGKEAGPTVALRADMDALPIQDEKECEYRSQVPGVMHACGHDGHMAMLLGAATLLTGMRDQLRGQVQFLFQPAEELPPGWAQAMIRDGALEGVDAIFGIHLWSSFPVGCIGIRAGELMAAADAFELEILGKGGHGGVPHQAVDTVTIAAYLITQLQSIVSRKINPLKPSVVTVGMIEGGNAFNVIAEKTRMKGTVRSFDPETRQRIVDQMKEIIQHACLMHGADFHFDYIWGYPPLVNHPRETEMMKGVAEEIVGPHQVFEMEPIMGGEDFAYYLEEIPGAFCFVGSGNPDQGITAPHHHPRFDIDEEAMKVGVKLLVQTARKYLG